MQRVRCVATALVLAFATGCPGRFIDDASTDATLAADALDAAIVADDSAVFVRPDVPAPPRCGPDAIAYPTNLGACARAMPLPDAGIPAPGVCVPTVSAPAATLRTNERDGNATVMPSGRRVVPAAHRLPLSGFPMSLLRIPGTSFVVVSDGGAFEEHLRVVDTSDRTNLHVTAQGDQTFAYTGSGDDPALFYGLAYDSTAHVLYASGGGADIIYAYDLSSAGALTPNPQRTINLGLHETNDTGIDPATGQLRSAYPADIALSDDGTLLYAALQRGQAIGIFSTVTARLTRLIPIANIGPLAPFPYVLARRPGDSHHLYVSLWGALAVAEIDLDAAIVSRTFTVGKNPSEILFSPDGSRLLAAASDSDAISVIDLSLPSAPVRNMYLGGSANAARGISPDALAWGPNNTLYVAEVETNAVEVLDASTFAHLGRIPTEWYPTDIEVNADGSVLVTSGKGLGGGVNTTPATVANDQLIHGSIALYDASTPAALQQGDLTVAYNNSVMSTFNDVSCPSGAAYDFPIPRVGSGMASSRIRHVILVIKENKTYDALLGDYAGTPGNPADGHADLTLVPQAQMPTVFPNLRALVNRFASHDNFYSDAELSQQGHAWTSAGRTTDFTERSRLTTDGRGSRGMQLSNVAPVGFPEEGDIFSAMLAAHVTAENWGEVVSTATGEQRATFRYPGLYFNTAIHDIDKARAFADYAQGTNNGGHNGGRLCDIKSFTYILLPNDHTNGGATGAPTPVSHFEDNDEALGYLVDAVSHSVYWPETLIIVIEDDPAGGGDHVDSHRSIAVLASPWVRRGYTSHVHYDVSSLHHTIELILGVPPHNALVASSAPLFDAFTGTPDFTPFTYTPRLECEVRNGDGMRWAQRYVDESNRMDFSQPDREEGLARLLWQMLHDGQEPPWRADPDGDDDRR